MVAIKTHFDGKKIVVPKELRGAPPSEIILIVDKPAENSAQDWMKVQESVFAKVWDNEEDAIYDDL